MWVIGRLGATCPDVEAKSREEAFPSKAKERAVATDIEHKLTVTRGKGEEG